MKPLKLSKSYSIHSGVADLVSFREPKFADVMEIGNPIAQGVMADGVVVRNVNYDAVRAYAEKLIEAPFDAGLIAQFNVKDTMAVVSAILDFFYEPATTPSPPENGSSANEAGTAAPSSN